MSDQALRCEHTLFFIKERERGAAENNESASALKGWESFLHIALK